MIPDFVKRGQKVKLKDNEQAAKWLIDVNYGTIIESRAYGPNEAMVTVDFVTRRIHISHSFLEAVSG